MSFYIIQNYQIHENDFSLNNVILYCILKILKTFINFNLNNNKVISNKKIRNKIKLEKDGKMNHKNWNWELKFWSRRNFQF